VKFILLKNNLFVLNSNFDIKDTWPCQ